MFKTSSRGRINSQPNDAAQNDITCRRGNVTLHGFQTHIRRFPWGKRRVRNDAVPQNLHSGIDAQADAEVPTGGRRICRFPCAQIPSGLSKPNHPTQGIRGHHVIAAAVSDYPYKRTMPPVERRNDSKQPGGGRHEEVVAF